MWTGFEPLITYEIANYNIISFIVIINSFYLIYYFISGTYLNKNIKLGQYQNYDILNLRDLQ